MLVNVTRTATCGSVNALYTQIPRRSPVSLFLSGKFTDCNCTIQVVGCTNRCATAYHKVSRARQRPPFRQSFSSTCCVLLCRDIEFVAIMLHSLASELRETCTNFANRYVDLLLGLSSPSPCSHLHMLYYSAAASKILRYLMEIRRHAATA